MIDKEILLKAFATIREAILICSADGNINYTNSAMNRLFGYEKGELLGKYPSILNKGPRPELVTKEINSILELKGYWEGKINNKKKDGTGFISYARISALKDREGKIINFISTQHNITEQIKMEKILQESEEKYRKLCQSAMDGIYVISVDKGFEYVNPAVVKIFGYESEELCREDFDFFKLVHPNDQKLIRNRQKARIKGKRLPSRYEFRIITKDGDTKNIEVNTVLFGRKKEKILGVMRDITKHKKIEERLNLNQMMLEDSERELKSFSRKILAIREEEKKNLSTILHEELGDMAVGLSSYLASIEKDIKIHAFENAQETIEKSKSLLRKSISKLKKIAVDLRPPDLDILGLPGALNEYFLKFHEYVKLDIILQLNNYKKKASDKTEIAIYRIVQESFKNIIKHANANKAVLSLSSDEEAIILNISDDGRGFEVEKRSHKNSEQLGIRGMKEMAESLKGTFTINSAPGKGTKILVKLPAE